MVDLAQIYSLSCMCCRICNDRVLRNRRSITAVTQRSGS